MKKHSDGAMTQLLKNEQGIIKAIKSADVAEGVLIKKGPKVAYFDLGAFGTGVIYGAEYMNASDIIKKMAIGEKISAKVVEQENDDGFIELSLAEAGKQKVWAEIKEIKDKDEPIMVKIMAANSGGLITEVNGIKAFLPVSQLSNEHYPRVPDGSKEKILDELKKMVGTDLRVKIITNTQNMNKLIVSEREVANENVKELLAKYKVGDIVEGIISGVADFGAFLRFVDQPSIEGLIHISELDHKLIEHPKEVVKVNDTVRAQIVEVKEGRVSLSLKVLKPNPWDKVADKYKEGQEIKGTITRFNPFGAFVALDQEIQGLVHVTEFGGVDEMKAKVEIGKQYGFTVSSVKPAEKRIILKIIK